MAFSSNDPAYRNSHIDEFGFGPSYLDFNEEINNIDNKTGESPIRQDLQPKNIHNRGTTVYTCLKDIPKTDEFRLETVVGASPNVPICVHPTRGFVVHAAGSNVVLWDWRTDTRLNLKGHISPVTSLACSSNGLFIASADCGPEPQIILWDISGNGPGGQYREAYRVRRDLSANVAWANTVTLQFSIDSLYLISVEAGEKEDEGAQVCLWNWAEDFTLLQRCLIYNNGEQHIFPAKNDNPFTNSENDTNKKEPWEARKAGKRYGVGRNGRKRSSTSKRKSKQSRFGGKNVVKVVWIPGSNNFAVIFSHILWVFETDRGAMRLAKQQQFQGSKYTYELVDVVASGIYRLLVVLCRSGQLFVCDSSGAIVNSLGAPVKKNRSKTSSRIRGNKSNSKLAKDAEKKRRFTCINCCGDMVFVGANDGSIWTVEIRTLTWKRKLPFQHHLRERLDYPESNKNMNKNGPTSPRAWETPSRNFGPSKEEQQINRGPGWPVSSIATTSDDAFIVGCFADHSLAVFDLHNGRVTNHAVTHFGGVHSACWHPDASSSVLVTGSADQTVSIWQMVLPQQTAPSSYFMQGRNNLLLTGGGTSMGGLDPIAGRFWRAKPTRTFDVSQSLDPELRYQRLSRSSKAIAIATDYGGMFSAPKITSSVSRAAAAVEITAVAYHPRGGRIACGCSHGMIRVYSTMSGRLLYLRDIGVYTRSRAYGNTTAARVKEPGVMECTDIAFSAEGRYLACALAGGMTAVMDSWGAYNRGSLLSSGFEKAAWPGKMPPRLSVCFAQRPMGVRPGNLKAEEAASGTCVLCCTAVDRLALKEIQPGSSQSDTRLSPKTASLEGPSELKGLECPTVQEFRLDSACTTFSIHPSGNYVICLSLRGTILIYHLWLGNLRGVIPTSAIPHPMGTRPCFVQDPSGLYIAATCPVPRQSASIQLGANSSIECYRVVLYEVCSGRYAGHVTDLPVVQFLSWSPCGSRLTMGGADGCINVYRVSPGIYRNIEATLLATKNDVDFWESHPIFLEPLRPTKNVGAELKKKMGFGGETDVTTLDNERRRKPPKIDFKSGFKLQNGHYVLVSIRKKRIVEVFFTMTGERKRFKMDDGTLISLSVCDTDEERVEVLKNVLTPIRTRSLHLKERRLRDKIKSGKFDDINCRLGMKLANKKFVLVSVKNGRSVEVFTPSTGDQLRLRVNESALASLAVCDSPGEQVEVLKGILEGVIFY